MLQEEAKNAKEIKNLKDLEKHMKKYGWGNCLKDKYPAPYLWTFIRITHPELLQGYKDWYDAEIRGK